MPGHNWLILFMTKYHIPENMQMILTLLWFVEIWYLSILSVLMKQPWAFYQNRNIIPES